jgi:hypothetical protein
VDHYSYTPVFIGFGIMPLVCSAIIWMLLGPLRPPQAAAGSISASSTPASTL